MSRNGSAGVLGRCKLVDVLAPSSRNCDDSTACSLIGLFCELDEEPGPDTGTTAACCMRRVSLVFNLVDAIFDE
jgi:hypothetical protein